MTPITSYSELATDYIANSSAFRAKEGDSLIRGQGPQLAGVSHGRVQYSAREESSKLAGKYTRITVRDASFKRRHRYFFSFIKAIGSMFSRLRRIGSIKTYLGGRTVHLRSKLSQDDRIALATTKVFGTVHSLSTDQTPPPQSQYGIISGPMYAVGKHDLEVKVRGVTKDFNEELVPEKGFYEIQLSTAIVGTFMTEPHQISLIIDPHTKQFYLVDSKGMKPEKLAFYNYFNGRAEDLNVADFINELKAQERFEDYGLVATPDFQGAGDCVAVVEAVSRSLAVVRKQLIAEDRLDKVDKHYEIETAVGMVHENYGQTVTTDIRASLEAQMAANRARRR